MRVFWSQHTGLTKCFCKFAAGPRCGSLQRSLKPLRGIYGFLWGRFEVGTEEKKNEKEEKGKKGKRKGWEWDEKGKGNRSMDPNCETVVAPI